jgi:hypothetical protein
MRCSGHEDTDAPAPGRLGAARAALVVLAASAVAAGVVAPALYGGGRTHATAAVRPTDRQIAERTLTRYFSLLNEGRGSEFCSQAITATTLAAEGGIYACAPNISAYVKRLERRTYGATLQDLHYLFYMVADGIVLHCRGAHPCPSSKYGLWANLVSPGEVDWRTGSDPGLASSMGAKVRAVVDPLESTPARITLYYQAWDGRILRASWSTKPFGWHGSVVDTHAGVPFISGVRVVSTTRRGPDTIVARVSMRTGTGRPALEEFRLVRVGGLWRADTWRRGTTLPAA